MYIQQTSPTYQMVTCMKPLPQLIEEAIVGIQVTLYKDHQIHWNFENNLDFTF